jgi:hypothetical protein
MEFRRAFETQPLFPFRPTMIANPVTHKTIVTMSATEESSIRPIGPKLYHATVVWLCQRGHPRPLKAQQPQIAVHAMVAIKNMAGVRIVDLQCWSSS